MVTLEQKTESAEKIAERLDYLITSAKCLPSELQGGAMLRIRDLANQYQQLTGRYYQNYGQEQSKD